MASTAYPTLVASDPARRGTASGADKLIEAQVMAARTAGEQITESAFQRLAGSVDRACRLPARPGWPGKAAAHAEIFGLLAEVAAGTAAREHRRQARHRSDLKPPQSPALHGAPVPDGRLTARRCRRLIGNHPNQVMATHQGEREAGTTIRRRR